MLTANRIRLSLSLQAPFSMLSSSPLCDFRLVVGRDYPRPGGRNPQGVNTLSTPASIVLGPHSHAAFGQMGRPSRLARYVQKSDEVLATAKRRQALSDWRYHAEIQTGTAASPRPGHAPKRVIAVYLWV